jgi:RNA polymerase sigma-70 factor (ECF subfamily)
MGDMSRPDIRQRQLVLAEHAPGLAALLALVARGDHQAFELVYGELADEVLLEIWRTASRFDPARGSAAAWALTIAHRRAVDRGRSETAGSRREQEAAPDLIPDDDVAETVTAWR